MFLGVYDMSNQISVAQLAYLVVARRRTNNGFEKALTSPVLENVSSHLDAIREIFIVAEILISFLSIKEFLPRRAPTKSQLDEVVSKIRIYASETALSSPSEHIIRTMTWKDEKWKILAWVLIFIHIDSRLCRMYFHFDLHALAVCAVLRVAPSAVFSDEVVKTIFGVVSPSRYIAVDSISDSACMIKDRIKEVWNKIERARGGTLEFDVPSSCSECLDELSDFSKLLGFVSESAVGAAADFSASHASERMHPDAVRVPVCTRNNALVEERNAHSSMLQTNEHQLLASLPRNARAEYVVGESDTRSLTIQDKEYSDAYVPRKAQNDAICPQCLQAPQSNTSSIRPEVQVVKKKIYTPMPIIDIGYVSVIVGILLLALFVIGERTFFMNIAWWHYVFGALCASLVYLVFGPICRALLLKTPIKVLIMGEQFR